jgi:uncharacterized protein with von Willebrand factor type A (vWA) domain
MKQIFVGFEALAKLYGSLAEANMFFYRNHEDVDNFRNLIEQRAMVIEDTEVIISELKSMFFDKYGELNLVHANLIEFICAVVEKIPESADYAKQITDSLRELVETNKLVEKKVDSLQEKLKTEVGKIRQTSKSLTGYRQLETYGSCFINKIK